MSRAKFVISFEGPGVEDGRIDVRDLAPALLSLGRLIEASKVSLFGPDIPVKVQATATGIGSFEVSIDVLFPVWEQLKTLLTRPDVQVAKDLLEWIGIFGSAGGGVFALYRWLRGRRPDHVSKPDADGMVEIVVAEGSGETRIRVHAEVLRLYRDLRVNRAVTELLDTLESEAIESIGFREELSSIDPTPAPVVLTRLDRPTFNLPPPPEEVITRQTNRMALSIRSLAFQEGNKWRLFDGQNVITATIEDKDFIARVDQNLERFAKGDVLICEVETVQTESMDGLKTEHTVRRVLQHRLPPTQLSIRFEGEDDAGPYPL